MQLPRDPNCGCGAPAQAAPIAAAGHVHAREERVEPVRPAGSLPDLTGRRETGFRRWAFPTLSVVTGAAILGLAWASITRDRVAS